MKAINRAGNLKRITTHTRRRTRQIEAQARQAKCATLTPKERIQWLDQQGYVAKKERAKLMEVLGE